MFLNISIPCLLVIDGGEICQVGIVLGEFRPGGVVRWFVRGGGVCPNHTQIIPNFGQITSTQIQS